MDGGGWQVQALGHRLSCANLQGGLAPGGTLHIVLSGPSVAGIAQPARLSWRPTVVVNGSFQILRDAGCGADLYVVSDVGFVRRQWSRFVAGVQAVSIIGANQAARFSSEEEQMLEGPLKGLGRAQARRLIDQGVWIDGRTGDVAHVARPDVFADQELVTGEVLKNHTDPLPQGIFIPVGQVHSIEKYSTLIRFVQTRE